MVYLKKYKETINNIEYEIHEKHNNAILYSNSKSYYLNNKLHNESGPAQIIFYDNNNTVRSYTYAQYNQIHNESGPAYIEFYKTGEICTEKYYINDEYHNEHGPAIIEYFKNNKIKFEGYYLNDKLHNMTGPAEIFYYNNKNYDVKDKYYWINNKYIHVKTDEELKQYLKFQNF